MPFYAAMNWMFYFIQIQELNLKVEKEVSDALHFILNFDLKRIKLLMSLIWDIEYCLEDPAKNYLIFGYRSLIQQFNSEKELSPSLLCLYIDQHNNKNNPFLKSNFKLKKENAFYDLDQNLDFFTTFLKYFIIFDDTIKHIGFNNDYNSISYYIDKKFNKYTNIRLFLWKFFELEKGKELVKTSLNRLENFKFQAEKQKVYEAKIKEDLNMLLIRSRNEWENSSKKVEEIKVRNLALLKDLENYYNNYNFVYEIKKEKRF